MSATIIPFRLRERPRAPVSCMASPENVRDRGALITHFREAVIAADQAGLHDEKHEHLAMIRRVSAQLIAEKADPEFSRVVQALGGVTMEEHDAIACRRRFGWTWEECRRSILTRRHYYGEGGAA